MMREEGEGDLGGWGEAALGALVSWRQRNSATAGWLASGEEEPLQFNYLRRIAWDQEDARVDLVAVVLATQLYQEIVGPKAESTEAFFRDLSPEVVVAKMQAEVAPRTP